MFRYSIRDTLWLTVVIGLICGWWIDREQATRSADNRANQSEAMRRGMEKAQWDRDRYRTYLKNITGYDRIPPAPTPLGSLPSPAEGPGNALPVKALPHSARPENASEHSSR